MDLTLSSPLFRHECSSKLALIEAEWASIHGKRDIAREKYTNAILMARGMDNNQEVAAAHERAMYHYLYIEDLGSAKLHGQQSYEAYKLWGANAKADHLKNRLEHLFSESISLRSVHESNWMSADLELPHEP